MNSFPPEIDPHNESHSMAEYIESCVPRPDRSSEAESIFRVEDEQDGINFVVLGRKAVLGYVSAKLLAIKDPFEEKTVTIITPNDCSTTDDVSYPYKRYKLRRSGRASESFGFARPSLREPAAKFDFIPDKKGLVDKLPNYRDTIKSLGEVASGLRAANLINPGDMMLRREGDMHKVHHTSGFIRRAYESVSSKIADQAEDNTLYRVFQESGESLLMRVDGLSDGVVTYLIGSFSLGKEFSGKSAQLATTVVLTNGAHSTPIMNDLKEFDATKDGIQEAIALAAEDARSFDLGQKQTIDKAIHSAPVGHNGIQTLSNTLLAAPSELVEAELLEAAS